MMSARPILALAAGSCVALALVVGATALRSSRQPPPPPAAAGTAQGPRIFYTASAAPRLTLPDGRVETIRSVLNVGKPLHYGEAVWDDARVPPGPIWVRVDLKHQLLSVFRGGHEIGSAVILYGAGDKPSPIGTFPVLQKAADYHSRTYDADMPFALRLTDDGVAIHGSAVRRGAATHGCIGVPTSFARRLFAEIRIGDPVTIVGNPA
jgi:hypothetical protein